MSISSADSLRRHFEEAVAVESGFEEQLRAFAGDGDDEEVKQAFAAHAAETRAQIERLKRRLEEIGGDPNTSARTLALIAPVLQIAYATEERIVQNLLAAYTAEAGECAMCEALIQVARAAGDETTGNLVRSIQAEAHRAADKFWGFIPSRSIIAYNVLTIGEVDPAVETKVGEVSWTS